MNVQLHISVYLLCSQIFRETKTEIKYPLIGPQIWAIACHETSRTDSILKHEFRTDKKAPILGGHPRRVSVVATPTQVDLAGFPTVPVAPTTLTLPIRTKDEDAMATEKLYQMKNTTKHSSTNQQHFVSEYDRASQDT